MITIGFSSHRAETIPFARQMMEQHQIIVLEEPPHPRFIDMLNGNLLIADYLMEMDIEFPEFESLMCKEARRLHQKGKELLQVEPYIERLLEIHEYFAEGMTPVDVLNRAHLKNVYLAEKAATGALINFYARSVEKDFKQVIESVKAFAIADARRSNLRSMLRAKAIASLDTDKRIYVEAGYIHYFLYRCLMYGVKGKKNVRAVYLMQPVFKKLRCKRRNMGPGDILTLNYALDLPIKEDQADLLAARSLMYTKLIHTDEMLPDRSNTTPHSLDEALVNGLVDRLGFEDCKAIYSEIRFKNRHESMDIVTSYVST
ncbi:MAG: hypothetical protein JRF17_00725 [Deltaproteobacteria bacterium]|jgi:hypothetical protein|nr:hypothetical protein [Deltaproteobacteria bacterium]